MSATDDFIKAAYRYHAVTGAAKKSPAKKSPGKGRKPLPPIPMGPPWWEVAGDNLKFVKNKLTYAMHDVSGDIASAKEFLEEDQAAGTPPDPDRPWRGKVNADWLGAPFEDLEHLVSMVQSSFRQSDGEDAIIDLMADTAAFADSCKRAVDATGWVPIPTTEKALHELNSARVPDRLDTPSQLGQFRDLLEILAEAVHIVTGKSIKAPDVKGAVERYNKDQLKLF